MAEYLVVNANGHEWCAINVMRVAETMSFIELSHYPGQVLPALGFFSLRGEIISVFSMSSLLSLPNDNAEKNIVIIDNGSDSKIGMAVNSIFGVINIQDVNLRDPKNLTDNDYIENVVFQESKVISLLNIKKMSNLIKA